MLAACWAIRCTAFAKAAAKAKTTVTVTSASAFQRGGRRHPRILDWNEADPAHGVRWRRTAHVRSLLLDRPDALFEQPLAVPGPEACRLRARQEVGQGSHELPRCLDLREMADTLDDHEAAAGNRFARRVRMTDGDDV